MAGHPVNYASLAKAESFWAPRCNWPSARTCDHDFGVWLLH